MEKIPPIRAGTNNEVINRFGSFCFQMLETVELSSEDLEVVAV
jgi:hypothetical protein